MEQLQALLDVIKQAIEDGNTITIKADEISINGSEITASAVEITME